MIEKFYEGWNKALHDAGQCISVGTPTKGGIPETLSCSWSTLKSLLLNFVDQTLPCCVDKYSGFGMNIFGTPSALKQWAEAGISFQSKGASGQAVAAFKNNSITADVQWFEQNPQHPLAKMRDLCLEKLKNTVGRNTPCSIRKIYIELQRAPYGLRCNPYSAFVLGFVLKEFLTQKQPLQWTNGQITRQLDQPTLAEIIEEVVKNDGKNNIKAEKLLCRLSKEEKAFIEQAPQMFGISFSKDPTVESVIQECQHRIENISGRVPLWCLPEYIDSLSDPQTELCRGIIENFCAASLVSSKSKTPEDRSNAIQQIGKFLLETDGLAQAFSRHITKEKFSDAFLHYIDTKEPALKQAAVEAGDLTRNYCNVIKEKVAETASWLWKEDDYTPIIACTLREYQVTKHLMPLWNSNGFVPYKTVLSHLRDAVFQSNKISLAVLVQKYPSLQGFIDCLKLPQDSDISETLLNILQSDAENVKNVFFSVSNEAQIKCLKEQLNEIPEATLKEIYGILPKDCSVMEGPVFLSRVRAAVQDHWANSLESQIKKLWREKTQTDSPDDWAVKNALPLNLLFADSGTAKDLQTIFASPKTFTSEKMQTVHDALQSWTLPEISEKQKELELAKSKISKLNSNEAKNLLNALLEQQPDMVLPLLR